MIDFISEKKYATKELKKNIIKHDLHQEVFRIPQFQCSCISNDPHDNRLIIFFGLSNGCIISVIIYRQKSLYNKLEDIILYKTSPKEKFRDYSISALLLIKIRDNPRLLSAGTDGSIKMWNAEPELREKDMIHFIDNIYNDRSTVIELIFYKKKNLIIGIFSDIKIRVLAIQDYLDDKKINKIRLTVSSIIEFNEKINPNKDKQYLLTTMSLKDSDITELFLGDNKGNILIYHFVDDNYLKYQSSSSTSSDKSDRKKKPNFKKNKFNFTDKINLHKTFGVIKVVHSQYDNLIYSSGYDNHIICYNTKNNQKVLDILNSNNKNHITNMYLSNLGRELIVGDDNGNITFIDILSKSEFRYKLIKEKLCLIKPIKIFPKQEHIFLLYENYAYVSKIIRKTKVAITRHHDAEIMKIFITEPVIYDNTIVEDLKVISLGFDKKIKVWDFLTMECVNEINGPELPKVSVNISSACYLKDSQLIAIGTESGRMFFWDLVNSEYLPINYEEKYMHKNAVTDIISFFKKNKEDNSKIECMLSCSIDGLIMFWEINKIEIKDNKKKNIFDFEKSDEFIMNELKKREEKQDKLKNYFKKMFNNKNNNEKLDLNKYLQNPKRKELKIYKCSPSIKRCINTQKLIKNELKFNVLAFQDKNNFMTIFAGTNDNNIYIWDYIKEKYIGLISGSNSFITCMVVFKNYLFSGGIDGLIDVWNISSTNREKDCLTLNNVIKDPDITGNFKPRINDMIFLTKINILIFCNNNKKIYLYDIIKKVITGILKRDNETICLNCLECYGKLLCGTREKMIIDISLNEELKNAGYKAIYDKFSFMKNKANYENDELDNYIDNFSIMKSITKKDDLFDNNIDKNK